MPHPIQDEPSWEESAATDGAKTYSRPLLGIEIIYDLCNTQAAGLTEVCMGFTFNTSLSAKDLVARTRDSLAMARYQIPSIASTIISKEDTKYHRFWQYTPLQTDDDNLPEKLSSWIDDSLTIRHGPIDTEAFVAEMNQRRTPYLHSDGHEQHIHFYLLIDSFSSSSPTESESDGGTRAALFIHGGHILLDARPALRCLNLLFEWIINGAPELAKASWGSEWVRLPVGPLAATGGPRDDYDTEGLKLMKEAGEIMMDPTPTLSFTPSRTTIAQLGKMTRFQKSFDEETTSNILKACKKTGFTMQHLIEAALILHVIEGAEADGLKDVDVSKAHVTLNPTTIAQENFLIPPHKSPSHFIAGLIVLPVRVTYQSIPTASTATKRERLLAIMALLKPQYDRYLANKNTPHILPARLALAPEYPPTSLPPIGDPYSSTMSNLGNLNAFVHVGGSKAADKVRLEIEEFNIGLRLHWFHLAFHTWTLNGRLHVLVQASDAWDDERLKTYLDDLSENISAIANGN